VLLFIQLNFGGFQVYGKFVLSHVAPLALAGIRVMIATPLLLLLAWKMDRVRPAIRDYPYLALLGCLGVLLNQILFIVGLQYTTAINASILMPTIPVFAVAIAALAGIERMSAARFAGVLLAVTGALVMLNPLNFSLSENTLFGNMLICINCVSYAGFLVLQKPLLKRLPPLTVIAWSFLFGGAAVFLISLPALSAMSLRTLPWTAHLGIIYIVLLPTTMNYALNTWAIQRSTPALVATYVTLQPLVASILAVLFLHETAGGREVCGFLLIVAGLLIVSRYAKQNADR